MVVRKKKKITKKRGRGSGYGSHKKHRGGGSRGGRGLAGLHKHKRMTAIKYMPEHFGKKGFKRPQEVVKEVKTINLKELDSNIEELLKKDKARKKGETITVDLTELGYDKLLGSGQVRRKLKVKSKSFSKKAIKKLEDVGGEAIEVS